jgi:hypothetical protein
MPSHDPYWCERCGMSHRWRHQEGDYRQFPEDLRDCCKNAMGSHWHCGRCDAVSSMLGHYTTFCRVQNETTDGHMCCPNDCELV